MEQSTKAYEPGTVAEVTLRRKDSSEAPATYRAFWSAYEKAWVSAEGGRLTNNADFWDIDVRPLVVIDLANAPVFDLEDVVRNLRSRGGRTALWLADQIEVQTQPPRIPEPGWGEKVKAHVEGERPVVWLHYTTTPGTERQWVAEFYSPRQWEDLIDPEAVSS